MSDQQGQGGGGGGEDVERGLGIAQQVIGGVQQVAETVQGLAEGGGDVGDIDAAGALGTTGGVLGQAGGLAGQLGAPAEAVQAIGIASQAAGLASAAVHAVEGVVEAIEALTAGNDEHRHVELAFACPDQPDAEWMVRSVTIEEALNTPYLARIELVIEDLDARPRDLLGLNAGLTLTRASLVRDFCGIIRRVEHGRTTDRFVTATIELVPALRALEHRRDSRVFQKMTVPAILHEVLGNALDTYSNRELDDSNLRRTYPEREYCVQYNETDLDFVHRLMEEEGISFHFAHDIQNCREKLVLTDSNEGFLDVETFGGRKVIPYVAQRNEIHGAEPVHALLGGAQLTSTSFVAADFDWTMGEVERFPITAERRAEDKQSIEREVYDHTTGFTHSEYADSHYAADDSEAQTRLRHELVTRDMLNAIGSGVVTGFGAGTIFTLECHPKAELDGKYLLTRVTHRAVSAALRDALGGAAGEEDAELDYQNSFECIPADITYRPDRKTPKPRAHGVLTAIVVGPHPTGEIHTDDYGRVKVQFHWDRAGLRNEDSSCFLRVMQAWAGAGRGIQTFPRIGDEVVIDFIGGDVDRPLVVGSLYSAANPPPYNTAQQADRTTIKSKTVPADGDKYNEICLDDKKDHEQVIIHASRDLNETVDHCHSTTVVANQSNSVGGNRTHSVDKNETITIGGSQKVTVEGGEKGDGQSITGAHLVVKGLYVAEVEGGIDFRATEFIRFAVGDTYVQIEPDSITAYQKDGQALQLLPAHALLTSKEGSAVTLTADAQLHADSGGDLTLTAEAQLTGSGATVLLDGDATVASDGDAQLRLSADAVLTGANATLDGTSAATVNGANEATLTSGPGTVRCSASATEVTGTQVDVSGQATVNVTGGVIRLN